ncbi:hypothetical protein [Lentilactobacillus sp. Marseille-Q4993]|uniref:hypothetical protein n=1 Tax=Lentilactobacillus sp. Marseille-Q4993 TaxID=3039492 RepID=UPI0024BD54AD|nr:hypothetical protein [Lentilactobacillus sp. Marseille-Q4993]
MGIKKIVAIVLASVSLGITFAIVSDSNSTYAATTPKSVRGTFYQYNGKKTWRTIKISKSSAYIKSPGVKAFKISTSAKSNAHKMSFKGFYKVANGVKIFYLQPNLKYAASSAFPGNGLGLTYRKINGKKYKVIRGYQGGVWFDFVSHKVPHSYGGLANGSH